MRYNKHMNKKSSKQCIHRLKECAMCRIYVRPPKSDKPPKKLGWQTELERRFSQLHAGFHVPFWSSDRLIFMPFRKSEERE